MISPDFLSALRDGHRGTLARAITAVENTLDGFDALMDSVYPETGRAWRIGVTGPPGAGKSTLVDGLIERFRASGETVAVVAVDPSSPFTGGALLGDRIRMGRWGEDPGVFVRSLASRGSLGGLSLAAEATADLLDAAGYEIVLTETLGVGQAEIDVVDAADTVLVVLVPESGDAVQAMKAGLMEIADCFCVNKADHPEAERLVSALRSVLHLRPSGSYEPPIVRTAALRGDGLDELAQVLRSHRAILDESGRWVEVRLGRFRRRVRQIVRTELESRFWSGAGMPRSDEPLHGLSLSERRPYALARSLLSAAQNG